MAEIRKKRRLGRWLIALVVIAILAAGGFYTWRYLNTYESTDDAQVDGHINAISSRIAGNVIAVLAEDQQIVKAGDVLVQFGDKPIKNLYDFTDALRRSKVGDLVDVTVLRDGKPVKAAVKLEQRK